MKKLFFITIALLMLAIAGPALAGGFDAGLITVTNMSGGVAQGAAIPCTAGTTTNTVTTNFVDISKFVGPVLFRCLIGTNATGSTGTITPALQSVEVVATNGAISATNTVPGTGLTTVTNGPKFFSAKIEHGAFSNRYVRMSFVVVGTDTVPTWVQSSQIIGFTK